jgi:hypothetical protein
MPETGDNRLSVVPPAAPRASSVVPEAQQVADTVPEAVAKLVKAVVPFVSISKKQAEDNKAAEPKAVNAVKDLVSDVEKWHKGTEKGSQLGKALSAFLAMDVVEKVGNLNLKPSRGKKVFKVFGTKKNTTESADNQESFRRDEILKVSFMCSLALSVGSLSKLKGFLGKVEAFRSKDKLRLWFDNKDLVGSLDEAQMLAMVNIISAATPNDVDIGTSSVVIKRNEKGGKLLEASNVLLKCAKPALSPQGGEEVLYTKENFNLESFKQEFSSVFAKNFVEFLLAEQENAKGAKAALSFLLVGAEVNASSDLTHELIKKLVDLLPTDENAQSSPERRRMALKPGGKREQSMSPETTAEAEIVVSMLPAPAAVAPGNCVGAPVAAMVQPPAQLLTPVPARDDGDTSQLERADKTKQNIIPLIRTVIGLIQTLDAHSYGDWVRDQANFFINELKGQRPTIYNDKKGYIELARRVLNCGDQSIWGSIDTILAGVDLNSKKAGASIKTLKAQRFNKEFMQQERQAIKKNMYLSIFEMVQQVTALFKVMGGAQGVSEADRNNLLNMLIDQVLNSAPPKILIDDEVQHVVTVPAENAPASVVANEGGQPTTPAVSADEQGDAVAANESVQPTGASGPQYVLADDDENEQSTGADGGESAQVMQGNIRKLRDNESKQFKTALLAIVNVAVAEKDTVDDLMRDLTELVKSDEIEKDVRQIKRVIDNIIGIVTSDNFVTQHKDNKDGIKLFWQAIYGIIEDRFIRQPTGDEPKPKDEWGRKRLREDREFGQNLLSVLKSFASLIEKSVEQQRVQEPIAHDGVQNGSEQGEQRNQNRERQNVGEIANKIQAVVDSLFDVVFQVQPQPQHQVPLQQNAAVEVPAAQPGPQAQQPGPAAQGQEQVQQGEQQNAYVRTNEFYASLEKSVIAIANAVADNDISDHLDGEFFNKFAKVMKVVSAGGFADNASLFEDLPALLKFYLRSDVQREGHSIDDIKNNLLEFIGRLRTHLVPQGQDLGGVQQAAPGQGEHEQQAAPEQDEHEQQAAPEQDEHEQQAAPVSKRDNEKLAQDIAKSIESFLGYFKIEPGRETPDHIKQHATQLAGYVDSLVGKLDNSTKWGKVLKKSLTIPSNFIDSELAKVANEQWAERAIDIRKVSDSACNDNVKLYEILLLNPQLILLHIHIILGHRTGLTLGRLQSLLKDPAVFKVALYSAELLDNVSEIKKKWRELGLKDIKRPLGVITDFSHKAWEITKLSTTILVNVGIVAFRMNGILVDLSSQKAKEEVSAYFIILMMFILATRLSGNITNVPTMSLTLGVASLSVSWLVFANFVQWRSILNEFGVLDGDEVQSGDYKGIIDSMRYYYNNVANRLSPVGTFMATHIAQRLSEQTRTNLNEKKAKIVNATNIAYKHFSMFKDTFMAYSPEEKGGIALGISLSLTLLFHVGRFHGGRLGYIFACTTGAISGVLTANRKNYSQRENLGDGVSELLQKLVVVDQVAEVEGADAVSAAAMREAEPGEAPLTGAVAGAYAPPTAPPTAPTLG